MLICLVLVPIRSNGQSRTWELGIAGGSVYSFRSPLRIQQDDAAPIRIISHYITEPFTPPVYYDVRVNTWNEAKGWQLKFTHHKLILQNRPPEVQRFSITDGFNLLTINRLWRSKGFICSVGGGVVITHPESTIRNKPFPENGGILNKGYYISGPTVEAALAKQFCFGERWFVFGEGRVTASYVHVPVVDGHAKVTNAALHFLLGTGLKLYAEKEKPGSDRF
jgi:hypothetical protein